MASKTNSSASGNGIVDEKQRRSLWMSKVEHRLQILKEGLHSETDGFQILKVPEPNRQPSEMFTPLEWRLGLHNRENLDTTTGSEDVKLFVPILFGLDEDEKWVDFCDDVVPEPKRMLACYGLHEDEVTDERMDEIKQVLAFDALSLASKFEIYNFYDGDRILWTHEHITVSKEVINRFLSIFWRKTDILNYDLCRIENQIPFDLINRAIKHIKGLTNPFYEDEVLSVTDANAGQVSDPYLEKWMKAAVNVAMRPFMDISDDDFYRDANLNPRLSESHHILDAAYKAICGKEGLEQKPDFDQKEYIHIPSATELKHSGIRIVGVVGPLCTMSYTKGTKRLSLPKMKLYDETIALIRNMGRYEEYFMGEKCMFHNYVNLMIDLIHTPEDMQHLMDCGVIDNVCGSRGFDMWKPLDEGIALVPSSKEHNRMKMDIKSRCKMKLPKYWSEFKMLFLSRPWLLLSAIAVTLVTLATLIQTYAAVIGSNGMKPQFNKP